MLICSEVRVTAAATESRICQMLRDHLVEVIASMRSQAEMVEAPAAHDPLREIRVRETTRDTSDQCAGQPRIASCGFDSGQTDYHSASTTGSDAASH